MPSAQGLAAELSRTIAGNWLREVPLICGPIPAGRGTPHCFVCVSSNSAPVLRVDVHADQSAYCFREEILLIGETLFIGVGRSVFVIDVGRRHVNQCVLDCYFGYFHTLGDGVLVCTGASVYRMAIDGSIAWIAKDLGVDGVVIREVRDGTIFGDAECDPPDGWRPFAISLDTGSP